ncbi:MAG: YraN family protein [bacterium]
MKQFSSEKQKIGELGESITVDYLVSRGFIIVERNYTKKIGEIDIVARLGPVLHFIEVKTLIKYGSCYNPFENITGYKIAKIKKTVLWYLAERKVSHETKYMLDAVAVHINRETRIAKLSTIWNITDTCANI